MATQSVDALTSVAWMLLTFVPVHDALLTKSKISTVAPEAANGVLTLSEKVGTCVVAFIDVVFTILTLPSVFTILDAVYGTSVRVARTIHRTVWSMISFGAKEPGCESHTDDAVVESESPVLVVVQYVLTSVRPLVRSIQSLFQQKSGGVIVVNRNLENGGWAHRVIGVHL